MSMFHDAAEILRSTTANNKNEVIRGWWADAFRAWLEDKANDTQGSSLCRRFIEIRKQAVCRATKSALPTFRTCIYKRKRVVYVGYCTHVH